MTKRLYYDDSYMATFRADVIEQGESNQSAYVTLDRTFFYPESGGQPADRGFLAGSRVLDVQIREEDQAIIHLIERPVAESSVEGKIDWLRRFDHMQQHTGQHILSQAFIQVASADTVSFHLSSESCSIDISGSNIPEKVIAEAEQLANEIVWKNKPVRVKYVDRSEAERLILRKVPEAEGERLRLIDIENFDLTACGGTHVSHSGEVGLVKIVSTEKHREGLRIHFVCGGRALADYRSKHDVVKLLETQLTTGYREIPRSVQKLTDEMKSLNSELRILRRSALQHEANELLTQSDSDSSIRTILRTFRDRDPVDVRFLANELAAHSKTIALLGLVGNKQQIILARSNEIGLSMTILLDIILNLLGGGGGGGSDSLAQGGGFQADELEILEAFNAALNQPAIQSLLKTEAKVDQVQSGTPWNN